MDDELLQWRGPFRSLPRPLGLSSAQAILTSMAWLAGIGTLATLPDVLGFTHLRGWDRLGMTGAAVVFAAITAGLFALARGSRERLEIWLPPVACGVLLAGAVLLNMAVVFVGSDFGGVTVFFVELLLMGFFVLRRPWALALTVTTLGLFAVALGVLDDPPSPLLQFANVMAAAVATGVLVGAFANRLDDARHQLTTINGRFRRFLAPQVADVLTTGEDALAPHRSEIAVAFVDLRGFTAFTNASEPDQVVAVLDEYYAAVGTVVDRYNGTIGGFDGDGVFAFLGDPIRNDDAATDAVSMAREIATELDRLTEGWGDLGYGIGLAYGTATVGVVGFEGRLDYTPVGVCVNLAARLCSDAKHREIVIDASLKAAAGEVNLRDSIDLKGFGLTETYAIDH